jgi:predicted dinucleotide-utilizing enzyme
MRPLRTSLKFNMLRNDKRSEIYVYDRPRIEKVETTLNELLFKVSLAIKGATNHNVKWERSRRLKNGQVIIIVSCNFLMVD